MVYGVIEVKTRIDKKELADAFNKFSRIHSLCKTSAGKPNKKYLRPLVPRPMELVAHQQYSGSLPPRFFIFGYEGPSEKSLSQMFDTVTRKMGEVHVDGLCVLDEGSGLFLQHMVYREPHERTSPISTNGFWRFLMDMPVVLNSLVQGLALKVDRESLTPMVEAQGGEAKDVPDSFFYRRDFFDPVDIEHYNRAASLRLAQKPQGHDDGQ